MIYYATHSEKAEVYVRIDAPNILKADDRALSYYGEKSGTIKIWNLPPSDGLAYVLRSINN